MKPHLKDVTLVAVDTTSKSYLALRAIEKSLEQCSFGVVKLLTDNSSLKYSVPIRHLDNMDDYSVFCIKELHKYVETGHCLLIQYDGYVLNGSAWNDEFLKYDYIGSPWGGFNIVGNGGFSLRSRRLLQATADPRFTDNPHPEDDFICRRHRKDLELMGIRFCPLELAHKFSVEGASFVWADHSWTSDGRKWNGQFGFHSYLTPITGDRPMVFHHSGDMGDIIYSLIVMKILGGGVLFLSSDCRYPHPAAPRVRLTHPVSNLLTPFLAMQDYVWNAKFTPDLPYSCDVDLNAFRLFYRAGQPLLMSTAPLWKLHTKCFELDYPEDDPWLTVDKETIVPGRPIVVNLTNRYRNLHFPWLHLIKRYSDKMAFVGLGDEYGRFNDLCCGLGKTVPWVKTETVSDLARIISGSKVFIGNQSAPMAIALGLGKNVIQECWQGNPNCLFKRDNAVYWGVTTTELELEIPKNWL